MGETALQEEVFALAVRYLNISASLKSTPSMVRWFLQDIEKLVEAEVGKARSNSTE